jgi:phosphomannomutase
MSIDGSIFKAYDVRGTCPGQLDARIARLIGRGLAEQLGARTLGVGMDPRPSSPELLAAFSAGAADAGASRASAWWPPRWCTSASRRAVSTAAP